MSVKKTVAKKEVAEKVAVKKEVVKKAVAKKAKQVKKTIAVPKVNLISFSVTAVIPTQQYGNIQPRIEVSAPTIEEARALVMPVIENLYETYAEMPLNGKPVKFLAKVTESERVVSVKPPAEAPTATVSASVGTGSTVQPVAVPTPAPEALKSAIEATPSPTSLNTQTTAVERPEPFKKAARAIELALSHDAIDLIVAQINKSVKINPEDKPELLNLATEKKNSIPF